MISKIVIKTVILTILYVNYIHALSDKSENIIAVHNVAQSKESTEENSKTSFRWGVATAAYQIEGGVHEDGRGDTIWDIFSRLPNRISKGENGNIAADSYHKYKEDIQLIKAMGLNSYRFSIAWSRIIPLGYGEINRKGIDYYNELIDEVVRNGLEPFVTLYHWDLPQGLEDNYFGWLNEDIEEFYLNYVNICFHEFGDRVKKWITFNEPWTACFMGYDM
eukprot:gene15604-21085_t